jgi:hypothetical protein
MMRNSYAISMLFFYGLLFIMLIHDFGVVDNIKDELIF